MYITKRTIQQQDQVKNLKLHWEHTRQRDDMQNTNQKKKPYKWYTRCKEKKSERPMEKIVMQMLKGHKK